MEKQELMPLPSMHYEYMERKMAKVSSDFHVRFDNAYYSVDKAFLHKSVTIGATATRVRIYSSEGELLSDWPRAQRADEWMTDPKHLPDSYHNTSEWNGPYFMRRAMTVGPNTEKVITLILKSRDHEAQTYRRCTGVLNFTKKYSQQALEECCKRALSIDKANHSFIKNSIASVAEELGSKGYNTDGSDEKNNGAFIMDATASDLDNLISRSESLLNKSRREDTES